jgi:hypothetical protein
MEAVSAQSCQSWYLCTCGTREKKMSVQLPCGLWRWFMSHTLPETCFCLVLKPATGPYNSCSNAIGVAVAHEKRKMSVHSSTATISRIQALLFFCWVLEKLERGLWKWQITGTALLLYLLSTCRSSSLLNISLLYIFALFIYLFICRKILSTKTVWLA